jgi:hypothetical protein
MIRQLRRLLRPVGAAPDGPLALAVYAQPTPHGWAYPPASDQGYEGVACVDDAARAVVLQCAVWREHRLPWAPQTAARLLAFVLSMQGEDGRFTNFILDWDGRPNGACPSSAPGGPSWTARALHALACGVSTFGRPDWAEAFRRGLPWLDRPGLPLDIRALALLAVLEYCDATGAADLDGRAEAWGQEIAADRVGDRLPDVAGRSEVHLWGHLQEAALARAGQRFGRRDLLRLAVASARELLVPPVERGFDAPTTLPFEVSSVVVGLDMLAAATGERRYAEQAALARAWFDGRNAARTPVYDRARGLVHDGIDGGRVNPGSGAEANVEGGLALLSSVVWDR